MLAQRKALPHWCEMIKKPATSSVRREPKASSGRNRGWRASSTRYPLLHARQAPLLYVDGSSEVDKHAVEAFTAPSVRSAVAPLLCGALDHDVSKAKGRCSGNREVALHGLHGTSMCMCGFARLFTSSSRSKLTARQYVQERHAYYPFLFFSFLFFSFLFFLVMRMIRLSGYQRCMIR
jgi:hypothetical protein